MKTKENYSLKQYYMHRKDEVNFPYKVGGMGIYAAQDMYNKDIIGVDTALVLAAPTKWYYETRNPQWHIDLNTSKFGISFGFLPNITSEVTSIAGILCGQNFASQGVRGAIDSTIPSAMPTVKYSRLGHFKYSKEKASELLKCTEVGDTVLIAATAEQDPTNPSTSSLPIEYDEEVRIIIKSLTDKGVHVIIPAGDGGHNLDDDIYNGAFNESNVYASNAIYVSSFNPSNKLPNASSNRGSRVTACAWGNDVVTTDYNPNSSNYEEISSYTEDFSGTMAASAQVAAAVITIQSILKRELDLILTPYEMKQILKNTGQQISDNQIATFPDVLEVLKYYGISK